MPHFTTAILLALAASASAASTAQEQAPGTLEGLEIAQAATQAVRDQFSDRPDVKVHAEITHVPKSVQTGGGVIELRADIPDARYLRGRRTVRVHILRDGQRIDSVIVGLDVRLIQEVPVASRNIETGEPIEHGDVAMEAREVRGVLRAATSPEEFVGKQARFSLRAGRELDGRSVEPLRVIRKGDRITILVVRGSLTIKAGAEARSDAAAGETVRVRMLDGGAEVYAIAEGPGQAKL